MNMKSRLLTITVALALTAAMLSPCSLAETAPSREYQIKAAFLYNLIKFVDWPKEITKADKDEPIVIGIIGADPFGKAFEPLKDKLIEDRKVIIKRFKGIVELQQSGGIESMASHPQLDQIKKCRALFVSKSENAQFEEITRVLKKHSVLTVADTKGFLEAGGAINFVLEDQKVRFEICVSCAKQSGLNIRSQLLRLAKRVVKDKANHADRP